MPPHPCPVWIGQRWVSKITGIRVTIGYKVQGNPHWRAVADGGNSYIIIHQETLLKHYTQERKP